MSCRSASGSEFERRIFVGGRGSERRQLSAEGWSARPMLIRLSAMTPKPTQRFMPSCPFVAAAVEAVASLQEADASFTAGAPLLGIAEPALLLEPLAICALG
jgi:hypothetical protein